MCSWGYFCVRKLYFTEVIICHPILNQVKWTHKLQSLNSAQLLCLILLCGKRSAGSGSGSSNTDNSAAFYESFKAPEGEKKSAPRKKLTVHYLTAGAQDTQQLLFMFSILEYP